MTFVPDNYIDDLVDREAGYVNHPADKGGETIWGITETVARAYGYTGPMRDMPRSTAVDIFRMRYWKQPKFDQLNTFDAALAEKLLDVGANMGPTTGVKFLQRALNALNQQAKIYPDIAVDGAIGPMTLAALRAFIAARGEDGRARLLDMVRAQQSVRYIEIAERDATQETFEYGWQRRAFAV